MTKKQLKARKQALAVGAVERALLAPFLGDIHRNFAGWYWQTVKDPDHLAFWTINHQVNVFSPGYSGYAALCISDGKLIVRGNRTAQFELSDPTVFTQFIEYMRTFFTQRL